MQLVRANDFENITETFVTGIASIAEIAPGVIRLSYFMDYEQTYDGERDRKVVDHQIWSLPQLKENLLIIQRVIEQMREADPKPQLALVAGMH